MNAPASLFPVITSDVAARYVAIGRNTRSAISAQLRLCTARAVLLGVILAFAGCVPAHGAPSRALAPTNSQKTAGRPPAVRLSFLAAIVAVEGVKDPARVGADGELGFYRIRPATWRQHTRAPFVLCGTDRQLEQAIAEKHLAWLTRAILAAKQVPTPYRLALAWNAGLEGSQRANTAARDYARRVANLCSQ